jgi:uncharacterized RDD family membrane protein YckC
MARPLDELWYLQGEAEALGPYEGHAIKAMIEAGSVGAASLVAKVGASQWSAVADVPAFAAWLPARGRAPVKYAGFWIRLLAYAIDMVLVYILAAVVGMVIVGISFLFGGLNTGDSPESSLVLQALPLTVLIGVVLVYYTFFQSRAWQATPGKRICRIHIIRQDGGRVSGLLALGRYLSYLVSSLPLGLGFFMIGWTDQKKGLHDMICGTRVAYGRL